jgi:MarR family 2-MHQ and catechol resistance regulon transcriptional repressor
MSLQDELGLQLPFKDVRHETVLSIVRTANLLSARAATLFRQYDLTEAQFNVLFSLKFTEGNVTQAELGKRLVVTRASITSVLDKLEAKVLVARQNVPDNRRIHHVVLTEQGLALISEVEPKYRQEIYAALDDIDTESCHTLIHQLQHVRDRVQPQ